MKNERDKEIELILRGFICYEGMDIKAAGSLGQLEFQGFLSGVRLMNLFGLSKRSKQFKISSDKQEKKDALTKAFKKLGTGVKLETAPDAAAVFCPSMLFKNSIVTLENKGKNYLVSYYSMKTIWSALGFRFRLSRLEKHFGSKLQETKITMVQQDVKTEPQTAQNN